MLWREQKSPELLSMATFLYSSLSLCNPKLRKPYTLPKLGFLKLSSNTLNLPKASTLIQFHRNPHRSFLTTFPQKVAILIVGSLILFARFNPRPALALSDASKTALCEKLYEKNSQQNEKFEDEGLYVKILEQNPDDVEALKVVLYGKMRKGKIGEAVKCVERLIVLEPGEVDWRLLEALCYELMGDIEKAKELFREILEERPLLVGALHGLAMAMHKNHEGWTIFEILSKALALACREKRVPEERNIRILIAQMHVVEGDLEVALQQFQDLANHDPRDFRPHLCQGIIYSLLGKKIEAEEQFEMHHSLIPDEYPQKGFINDLILAAKVVDFKELHQK